MTLSWNSALDHYCCWHAIYTSYYYYYYYYYIAYYADSRRYICIVYSYARAHIVHNAMCEIYRSKLTRSLRVIEPLAEPTADPIQSINYNYEHIIYCTQHTYNVHMRRVKYIYFVFFFPSYACCRMYKFRMYELTSWLFLYCLLDDFHGQSPPSPQLSVVSAR